MSGLNMMAPTMRTPRVAQVAETASKSAEMLKVDLPG